MASKDARSPKTTGMYYLTKRPTIPLMLASWLSPQDQKVMVTFYYAQTATDADNPRYHPRSINVWLLGLDRSLDGTTMHFTGLIDGVMGSSFRISGSFLMANQPARLCGLMFDRNYDEELKIKLVNHPAARTVLRDARSYARDIIGPQWIGEQIAIRALNAMTIV